MGETPWRFKSSQPHHRADAVCFGTVGRLDFPAEEGDPSGAFDNALRLWRNLVDAQVSGTCGRKAVEVRVLSAAPPPFVS